MFIFKNGKSTNCAVFLSDKFPIDKCDQAFIDAGLIQLRWFNKFWY